MTKIPRTAASSTSKGAGTKRAKGKIRTPSPPEMPPKSPPTHPTRPPGVPKTPAPKVK